MKRILGHIALLLVLALPGCREDALEAPQVNQQPRTFLWLFPEDGIATTVSRQHLRWWGEDPDGVLSGFLLAYTVTNAPKSSLPAPDTLRYAWVTANDSVFAFPLDTLFRYYLVGVRGVDNTFPGLPRGSIVRLTPFAFWDKDDNGSFGGTDEQLPTLAGAMDPTGAALTFPIRNSPPSVSFLQNPTDPNLPLRQPETTYTAATFAWTGSDPDGNNTLARYRIALNDTAGTWLSVPLRDTLITLVVPRSASDAAGSTVTAQVFSGTFLGRQRVGDLPGLRLDAKNVLYLQAVDVAGEPSAAIAMPSGTDRWYVKRPRGKLLLVGDYIRSDAQSAFATYVASLASVPGGQYATVDQLNIGLGLTSSDKLAGKAGALVPAYVDPALIFTFLLYDCVLWYTDEFPSLGVAQLSLFPYLQNGGRVIFSTMFLNTADPRGALRDFAPIDSVSSVPLPPTVFPSLGDSRIPAGFRLDADSSNPSMIYPLLAFNASPAIHSIFMRPIYRRTDARYIYRLQADTRARYSGTPTIGVVDGVRTIIFVGLPLHLLNNTVEGNPAGLAAFFETALTREFNPLQKVNRRRF